MSNSKNKTTLDRGRPSKYTPELIALAREYVNLTMPNRETDEVVHSIEGLCIYIKIARDTAYDWVKDENKEDFSDIFKEVMLKQGRTLVNKGLADEFNSPITKLMLTKHGYRDAVDSTVREVPIDVEAKKQADSAIDEFLSGGNKKNK